MNYIILWACVLVGMVIFEIATTQLVAIWFALASLVSLFAALFGANFTVQCILFVVVTIISLALTRPFVKKFITNKAVPTNADRNIGEIGYVINTIDNNSFEGRVTVDGLDWAAKSIDGDVIETGSKIVVKRIEGVKLIVSNVD